MALSDVELAELVRWRRERHRRPDLSGDEGETAAAVTAALAATGPDEVITGLGGDGVAAIYGGSEPGPSAMFRAELDALPIVEISDLPYRSERTGKAHLCGHDGHMAILLGLARRLGNSRPQRGQALVLFQPAEETGAGARAVIADARFGRLRPDYAFALHNMPGLPWGAAALAAGPAACASKGLRLRFSGRTAHASMPETGISPAPVLAGLMEKLPALARGGAVVPGFRLLTVTHATLGEPAFGIAPGDAELWLTLRALEASHMAALEAEVLRTVRREAGTAGLGLEVTTHDAFDACRNDADAARIVEAALLDVGLATSASGLPMRASEDFGAFSSSSRTALFLLGAGEGHPALHNPDYDFPDDLIRPGVAVFDSIRRALLGAVS